MCLIDPFVSVVGVFYSSIRECVVGVFYRFIREFVVVSFIDQFVSL